MIRRSLLIVMVLAVRGCDPVFAFAPVPRLNATSGRVFQTTPAERPFFRVTVKLRD